MAIIVVFARQGLRRNIEAVKIACQTRGLFHGNGMGYTRFKKHASNFSGIGDGRLCAPRLIASGFQDGALTVLYLFDGNGSVFRLSWQAWYCQDARDRKS